MGEVVFSSEDMEEIREEFSKRSEGETEHELANEATNGKVKWENLFPRMVLRVLLVEADDSTRQIVSALLRKCSYRVAAVSDGLKAWEVLRSNPHNIDLILTEVDLPSISGYALLTLIMEHDACKNTPVIMMSSHDSVNTVYKCMLRGAADYLVKPLRRNELRNLWQHVWRRQSSINGNIEIIKQDKVEGTSENNAASNYASDDLTVQRCKDHDDLSTCTKPEPETGTPGTDGQPSSLLELSLRGGHVSESEERNRLKHSSASAFTRYTSKPSSTAVDKQGLVSTEEMTLTNYGAIFRSVFSNQPGESACPNPRSPGECAGNASTSCRANESEQVKEHGNEGDQSASSSFCNASDNVFGHGGNTHRSVQREAALMKFRMKRKDRCYEKKVRYESRKKLAEQRPRVKGQFVRQHEVTNPSKVTN